MNIFLGYIFLGLSLAAPIGPINAAQLDKGIKNGFFHAWLVGLGSLVADTFFMLAVYFGIVHFLEMPFMQTFLWSFGCFVLIYTGIESLVGASDAGSSYKREKDESLIRSFFTGFFIALSNPLSILFWLGIYGSVLANTATKYDTAHLALYSGAIILGLIIWDITMAFLASSFRKFVADRFLVVISIVSGLSLIGFGVYFGIKAVQMLF